MRLNDMGMTIIIGAILLALGIGFGAKHLAGQPDSPVEEYSEAIAEDMIEQLFGLEDGSMNGKIDISPGSPEA